ncbi:MAG: hypothetical protein ACI8P9_001930 [Parasphingorhabdus sp.]|jgi:hypothetical protein
MGLVVWLTRLFLGIGLSCTVVTYAEETANLSTRIRIAIDGSALVEETISVRHLSNHTSFALELAPLGSQYLLSEVLHAEIDGSEVHWEKDNQRNLYFGTADSSRPPGRYSYRLLYEVDQLVKTSFTKQQLVWTLRSEVDGFSILQQNLKIMFPSPLAVENIEIEHPEPVPSSSHFDSLGSLHWAAGQSVEGSLQVRWPQSQINSSLYPLQLFQPAGSPVLISLISLGLFSFYGMWVSRPGFRLPGVTPVNTFSNWFRRRGPLTILLPGMLPALTCLYWAGVSATFYKWLFFGLFLSTYTLFIALLLFRQWLTNHRRRRELLLLLASLTLAIAVALGILINFWYPFFFLSHLIICRIVYRQLYLAR